MTRQLGRTFTIGESVGQRPQSLRRPPTGRRNVKAPGTRVTYVAALERGSEPLGAPPRPPGRGPEPDAGAAACRMVRLPAASRATGGVLANPIFPNDCRAFR